MFMLLYQGTCWALLSSSALWAEAAHGTAEDRRGLCVSCMVASLPSLDVAELKSARGKQ